MSNEVKSGVVDWLKGQPFNNVLIAALLGMIGWLGWYGITVAIPDHIKTIQSGYERIESSHKSQLDTMQETFERTLDRVTENPKPTTTTASK